MSEAEIVEEKPFWRRTNPVMWGLLASLVLTFIVVLAAFHRGEDGVAGAAGFLDLQPNEIGDTLAGLFSSLAFIWIVVTVFLQSQELAAQRDELVLARAEAKRTADALADQVELLQVQGEIFKDEQRQRAEQRADGALNETVEFLAERIRRRGEFNTEFRSRRGYYFWIWMGHLDTDFEDVDPFELGRQFDAISSLPSEELIRTFSERLDLFTNEDYGLRYPGLDSKNEIFFDNSFTLLDQPIQTFAEILPELSNAQRIRLRRLGIDTLQNDLERFKGLLT
ncbi:MAG: hypothetical protein R3D59_00640 [Paracoccaceae bacterium]